MKKNEIGTFIKKVYGKLWDIITLYEPTECYKVVPEGSKEEIWNHMETELLKIRRIVNKHFLANMDIRQKLLQIVDETEYFVKSYEQPGVVMRWRQINPKILFFDCSFDIMKEDPDLYKSVCRGLTHSKFMCFPDEELINAHKDYFDKIERRNNEHNFRYTKERVFQNELNNTLIQVFEYDFKEYL